MNGSMATIGASRPGALVAPMLATLGAMPRGSDWAFELKWDGVRAICHRQPGATVRLFSRNDLDVTGTYPELRCTWAYRRNAARVITGRHHPSLRSPLRR